MKSKSFDINDRGVIRENIIKHLNIETSFCKQTCNYDTEDVLLNLVSYFSDV